MSRTNPERVAVLKIKSEIVDAADQFLWKQESVAGLYMELSVDPWLERRSWIENNG